MQRLAHSIAVSEDTAPDHTPATLTPSTTAPSVTPSHALPEGAEDARICCLLALNQFLGALVHQAPFCSLRGSASARQFDDVTIANGKSHHSALRALPHRCLAILWHCLTRGPYDENTHVRNRCTAIPATTAA